MKWHYLGLNVAISRKKLRNAENRLVIFRKMTGIGSERKSWELTVCSRVMPMLLKYFIFYFFQFSMKTSWYPQKRARGRKVDSSTFFNLRIQIKVCNSILWSKDELSFTLIVKMHNFRSESVEIQDWIMPKKDLIR